MRAVLLAAATALLAACGGSGAASSSSPSPSSTTGVLRCSLPVVASTKNGGTYSSQSGFVSVPSGAFAPEAAANGVLYDRPYQRWLPAVAAQVLPDGSAYAYENQLPDGTYQIHVVQVATGADKVVYRMPYDNAYAVVALEPEGLYLVPLLHRSGMPVGLWLLGSTNAAVTAVPGAGNLSWRVIEGGAAWGGPVGGDSLDRLDLVSGGLTTWFTHAIAPVPGIGVSYGPGVVGFDRSGHPLVQFYPPVEATATPAPEPSPEVWLVRSPGDATRLTGFPPPPFLGPGVTDAHGVWLVGADGFYLYTDAGFRRAAAMPPGPVGAFQIAGACS